jgi:GTP-binding protein
MKEDWEKNIGEYLADRQSLMGIVLVMDVRHPMTGFDEMMVRWAIQTEMPLRVLLTKSDKLKKGPAKTTLLKVRNQLQSQANWLSVQLFSSLKKDGVAELESWLREQMEPETDSEDVKQGVDTSEEQEPEA